MTQKPLSTYSVLMLRYLGMSFITGAVAHGFFSGYRSMITAIIGVAIFVLALWIEHHRVSLERSQIAWNVMLAVGIGVFTGGIQHFPDSPERSVWIVPLGFILSIYAFPRSERFSFDDRSKHILSIVSLIVILLSGVTFFLLEQTMIAPHHH